MTTERHRELQLSFLTPADAELVHLMRHFLAEASRIYETKTGSTPEEALTITSPEDAHAYLAPEMAHLEQEHLRVLNLTIKNRILSSPLIYQGSLNCSHVRLVEIFRPAIIANAAGILVAHNHPSSDPTPSDQDIHLTRQLVEAGRLLDIQVLDHLVICSSGFVSMKERGLGF